MQVENMTSSNGNKVANQFIIHTRKGNLFQSYASLIAFEGLYKEERVILLDSYYWDYSKTTSKYRNMFLGMDTKEIKTKIADGSIKLVDLKEIELDLY